MHHLAGHQAILLEWKSCQLDLCALTNLDKANIFVFNGDVGKQRVDGVDIGSLVPANQAVAFAKISRSSLIWRFSRRSAINSARSLACKTGAALAVDSTDAAVRLTQLRMLVS